MKFKTQKCIKTGFKIELYKYIQQFQTPPLLMETTPQPHRFPQNLRKAP